MRRCPSLLLHLLPGFLAGLLLSEAAAQAPPPPREPDPRTSSQRVAADPAGQYLLIRKVVVSALPAASKGPLPDVPEGYDVARYCWTPYYVMGDWGKKGGLTSALVVLALEAEQWKRDLGRGGYPAQPLAEAIGRYEAGMLAAGASFDARTKGLPAFQAELENLRRATPGAAKTRLFGGCGGPGPAVQLQFKTQPEGGKPLFIAKTLHAICRAQDVEADDPARCDYWLESDEKEPLFFNGEIVWVVRWMDGTVARGEFDSYKSRDAGTVILREGTKK